MITYIFPNISTIPQRGGISSRVNLALSHGCQYVEIPADLVKNKTEMAKTGETIGSFLSPSAIQTLYDKEEGPKTFPYILHTEPSIPRMDGYGIRSQSPICWHTQEWKEKMIEMTIRIATQLNAVPAAIEIHPGDKRNGYRDIVNAMGSIRDSFETNFESKPRIFLENRTGQFIEDGTTIKRFWEYLTGNRPDMADECGIVLDVQQLYTVTRNQFLEEFRQIPLHSLKAFHIHSKHKTPSIQDQIPWRQVFETVKTINHPVLINPEVHHDRQIDPTIQFCEDCLKCLY